MSGKSINSLNLSCQNEDILMKKFAFLIIAFSALLLFPGWMMISKIRKPVDLVGFPSRNSQMDSLMQRVQKIQGKKILDAWKSTNTDKFSRWSVVISPHDDYAYAGWMYTVGLRNIQAHTVILVGVAHKAKQFGIEDKLVFDKHFAWAGPYGPSKVSYLRERILNQLPRSVYVESDSLHEAEHSLEALIPTLQYFNAKVEIIPILVPAMSFKTADGIALSLALAIQKVLDERSLKWKDDVAMVISSDAVHYGDEGWDGKNFAFYGADTAGYQKAVAHEQEIISTSLTGPVTMEKIKKFSEYTVQDPDYKSYKWTWCGRYSIPLGLLTAFYLQQNLRIGELKGYYLGYTTSIGQKPLPLSDLGLGTNAPANLHHWVGYAAIGYR
jgi:AmmeMemoRadiSam system protein B